MEAYAVQEAARETERIRIAREQAMQSSWGLRACCTARLLPRTNITQRVAQARIDSTLCLADVSLFPAARSPRQGSIVGAVADRILRV